MPTFYSHIRLAEVYVEDPEGGEYPGLDAAWHDAVVSAKHIISEALRSGTPLRCALKGTFEITDEKGRQVAVLPFADAIGVDLRSEGHGYSTCD
jgi:hypothetical protein